MAIDKSLEAALSTHEDAGLEPGSVADNDHGPQHNQVSHKVADVEDVVSQNDMGCDKEDPETKEDDGLPIDRGWAWVVLAGTAFYLIIFGGIKKNYGIFFVAIQERFGSTASLTSFLTTMQNLLMSCSALFIMTVGMQFMSNRTSIMYGSLVLTVSHIISAYATDIRMLFASVGFLEGIGTALVHPPITATLGEYFHKRRGLANGLAFSGASFGGLLFAPIYSALFTDYGYAGTFMIVAGLTLNILVTSALLRPVKSFERYNQKEEEIECLCVEIYQSMFPVILVEFLTLPKLKSCIGFTLLCHGLAVAATFPVVGSLRDSTGSYYASYHFLGTMSFAGAAFALSLPYFHRRQQQTHV